MIRKRRQLKTIRWWQAVSHPRVAWSAGIADWGNPHAALEQGQFWAILQRCLDNMPGRLARLFLMREVMEQSSEDICRDFAITPANLWTDASIGRARGYGSVSKVIGKDPEALSGMLTCREASVLISEARDRKLRLHERLGLRVHLWMCISCRRFNRQVRLMCRLLRSQTGPDLFDTPGPGPRRRKPG